MTSWQIIGIHDRLEHIRIWITIRVSTMGSYLEYIIQCGFHTAMSAFGLHRHIMGRRHVSIIPNANVRRASSSEACIQAAVWAHLLE